MTIKLLAFGDTHLGKNFPILPDALNGQNVTPIFAWQNTIDFAIKHQVDGVLLTGDVIENKDDRFEAFPYLSAGIRKLFDNKIPVFAIVGNHDKIALPRIAKLIDNSFILGKNSEWTSAVLTNKNGEKVNIIGWSFPDEQNAPDPMAKFNRDLCKKEMPNIALLHCSLDSSKSEYQPVTKKSLSAEPVDLWLLGHIHKPSDFASSHIGYLGSIVGFDITETGKHGPWLIEVSPNRNFNFKHISIAPLRWEHLKLDVFQWNTFYDPEDLRDALVIELKKQIENRLNSISNELEYVKIIGIRVFLAGRLNPNIKIRGILAELNNFYLININGVDVFIEKIIDNTEVLLNLEELAEQNDPLGILSKKILLSKSKFELKKKLTLELQDYLAQNFPTKIKKYYEEKCDFEYLSNLVLSGQINGLLELWINKANQEK